MPASLRMPLLLACFLLLQLIPARAQNCVQGSFARTYTASDNHYLRVAFPSANNELQLAGQAQYLRQTVYGDGWLARITGSGTPIWSRRYRVAGFTYTSIIDAIATPDGGTIAVGSAASEVGGSGAASETVALLLRTDRFGTVRDARTLELSAVKEEATIFTSIIALAEGGYLISGIQFERRGLRTRLLLLRTTADLQIVWRTRITSPQFDFRLGFRNHLLQRADGKVVTGMLYNAANPQTGRIRKVGFLLLAVEVAGGKPAWLQPYYFYDQESIGFIATASMAHIYEEGDGSLRWLLSYSDSVAVSQRPYTAKAAVLHTNGNGVLNTVTTYRQGSIGSRAIGGTGTAAAPVWLMDDGKQAVVVQNGRPQEISRQAGVELPASGPDALVAAPDGGLYLLGNGVADNTLFSVSKLNPQWQSVCGNGNAGVIAGSATESFRKDASDFFPTVVTDLNFPLPVLIVSSRSEELTAADPCPPTCCREARRSIEVALCGSQKFTLPGGQVADSAGSYYVYRKQAGSCDSLLVYEVSKLPDPKALNLGATRCLENGDTAVLRAPDGFDQYRWQGLNSNGPEAVVSTPGRYALTVSNSCGTATDTVQVVAGCDFPVYLPNAFTPNGDGLNDVWRYAQQTGMELVRLAVYSRWGDLVFQTSDMGKGWNGTNGGKPVPAGVYVYQLEVRNRRGEQSTRKGTVTLIR